MLPRCVQRFDVIGEKFLGEELNKALEHLQQWFGKIELAKTKMWIQRLFFRRKFSSRLRLGRTSFFARSSSRAIPGSAAFQFPVMCAFEGRE